MLVAILRVYGCSIPFLHEGKQGLLDALDHKPKALAVWGLHQEILTGVLVAATARMAFIEGVNFVDRGRGARLERHNFARLRRHLLRVGRVQ